MSSRKKVTRRFLILARDGVPPRQKGEILKDFTTGKVGVLYLDEWIELYGLFKNHETHQRILLRVRRNMQNGDVFLGRHSLEKSRQKFLLKVFSARSNHRR